MHDERNRVVKHYYSVSKKGKWVEDIDFGGESHWYCSCCNAEGWKYNKYCPHCGAKMKRAEENAS